MSTDCTEVESYDYGVRSSLNKAWKTRGLLHGFKGLDGIEWCLFPGHTVCCRKATISHCEKGWEILCLTVIVFLLGELYLLQGCQVTQAWSSKSTYFQVGWIVVFPIEGFCFQQQEKVYKLNLA